MKKRIMVVDDDPAVRGVLKRMLSQDGYEVSDHGAGDEALARMKEWRPDLVFLDMHLPRLSGLDTLRGFKRVGPHTPVVMITGLKDDQQGRDAIEEGAVGYLSKPVRWEKLRETLSRFLSPPPDGDGKG